MRNLGVIIVAQIIAILIFLSFVWLGSGSNAEMMIPPITYKIVAKDEYLTIAKFVYRFLAVGVGIVDLIIIWKYFSGQ